MSMRSGSGLLVRLFGAVLALDLASQAVHAQPQVKAAATQASQSMGAMSLALPQSSDAQEAVPPLRYRSPLSGVRSMADAPVGDWRQANDLVNERGGWKAHARAAQAFDQAASGASTPTPAPAAGSAPSAGHSHDHHPHHPPGKAQP